MFHYNNTISLVKSESEILVTFHLDMRKKKTNKKQARLNVHLASNPS